MASKQVTKKQKCTHVPTKYGIRAIGRKTNKIYILLNYCMNEFNEKRDFLVLGLIFISGCSI